MIVPGAGYEKMTRSSPKGGRCGIALHPFCVCLMEGQKTVMVYTKKKPLPQNLPWVSVKSSGIFLKKNHGKPLNNGCKRDMKAFVQKYWFTFGLILVPLVTVLDTSQRVSGMGIWIKSNNGPNIIIFTVFLVSGILLDAGQIKKGLTDIAGILSALFVIFVIAPVLLLPGFLFPMSTGIAIGFILVAAMPTTLSSGVVMTGASGGNMAHALVITISANLISVFLIPFLLSLMLGFVSASREVVIDKCALMGKLGLLVIFPLLLGLGLKAFYGDFFARFEKQLHMVNQVLILTMVWSAVSFSRNALLAGKTDIFFIVLASAVYHGMLVTIAALFGGIIGPVRTRRESVLFMGGQKTLTLPIILQMSLFPDYGIALTVCVIHHIVHLIMDGFIVTKLAHSPGKQENR